jgi:transcriptional regulator with XRE-family HTH domain
MSHVISTLSEPGRDPTFPDHAMTARHKLHRLAEVRRREGVTRRTIARRLGIPPAVVQQQERDNDIPLSTLFAWQQALNVPATELLVEGDTTLSTPVLRRARLVRMMKTVRSIAARSKQSSIRRLARLLAEQLTEVMPEVKEVEPWPEKGRRRTTSELGQAAFRQFVSGLVDELDRDSA